MNKLSLILIPIIYLQMFLFPSLVFAQCSVEKIQEAYNRCIKEFNNSLNFSESAAQGDCSEQKYKTCPSFSQWRTPTVDDVCPTGVNDPGGRCDDNDPCTQDSCLYYSYGQCAHYQIPGCGVVSQEPSESVCEDNRLCMDPFINDQGACEYTIKPDGTVCLFDSSTGHPIWACDQGLCTQEILNPFNPQFSNDNETSYKINSSVPLAPFPSFIEPVISWFESWLS